MNATKVMYGLGPNVANSYEAKDFFTKNRLSTTFPVSFLFYIGEEAKGLPPYYVKAGFTGRGLAFELDQVAVFGEPNAVLPLATGPEELLVTFETAMHGLEADVVFGLKNKKNENGLPLGRSFFEVKLTAVPDSSTMKANESLWGPEIVVRRANFSSALASALHGLSDRFAQGKVDASDINERIGVLLSDSPQTLANDKSRLRKVVTRLLAFLAELDIQRPFLLHTLWWSKVERKGLIKAVPQLPEKGAFDYLVWSDVATLAMPLRSPKGERKARALLKVALAFKEGVSELIRKGALDITDLAKIVRDANADSQRYATERQNDKEFSVSGKLVQSFVSEAKARAEEKLAAECKLFERGRFERDAILETVIFRYTPRVQALSYLAPERRLDQALLFTLTH